jgi:redox-sensitive bicupin YhaK (pirin superfamily)
MTAGTGVRHSDLNPSQSEEVHFLQIWIEPDRTGLTPNHEQRAFPSPDPLNTGALIASLDGRDGSLTIDQDVSQFRA